MDKLKVICICTAKSYDFPCHPRAMPRHFARVGAELIDWRDGSHLPFTRPTWVFVVAIDEPTDDPDGWALLRHMERLLEVFALDGCYNVEKLEHVDGGVRSVIKPSDCMVRDMLMQRVNCIVGPSD